MKRYELTENEIRTIFNGYNPFLPGNELYEVLRNLIDQRRDKRLAELERFHRGFGAGRD